MSNHHISELLNRLDGFINKYYTNLVIRGGIYLLLLLSALYIFINALENWFYFDTQTRTWLFYSFWVLAVGSLSYFVLLPLLKRWHILPRMGYFEAAERIGKHFPDINDKIYNILQLNSMHGVSDAQAALIAAGISQKCDDIKPFPILQGINFSKNKKYAKYLIVPLAVIGITYLFFPTWVEAPAERLWHHNTSYQRPLPFRIKILNPSLEVFSKTPFTLKVALEGEAFPKHLYLNYGGHTFLMQQINAATFAYTFSYLDEDIDFQLTDKHRFTSGSYHLKVLPKALLSNIQMQVVPPAYTQLKPYQLSDIQNVNIVYGSRIHLDIEATNCDRLDIIKDSISQQVATQNYQLFVFSDTVYSDSKYSLYAANNRAGVTDSTAFAITLIPDQYPSIEVQSMQDSTEASMLFFAGKLQDDFGLRRLRMHLHFRDSLWHINIPLASTNRLQSFIYHYDFAPLPLRAGEECTYYFAVQDNDAVQGYKTSKTPVFSFRKAAMAEHIAKDNVLSDSVSTAMSNDLKNLKRLQKDIEALRKELLNKDLMSWNDKQKMKNLIEEHKRLAERLQTNSMKSMETSHLSDSMATAIQKKEEALQQMLEEVLSPELQKKLEEFSKKIEEWSKEQSMDMLKDMEKSFEEYENALDRQLELFKRMDIENRLQAHIERLENMSKEEFQLAQQMTKENIESPKKLDDLKRQQAQMQSDFESLSKDMQQLDSLNNSLEQPMDMDIQEALQDSIQQSLDQSLEKMNSDPGKASPSQKKAGMQMQSLAEAMQMQFNTGAMEQTAEDARMLRYILQQLLRLSFHQEQMLDSLQGLNDADPAYNSLARQQFYARKHFSAVRDSLEALAKRQKAVKQFVIRSLSDIDNRTETLMQYMEEHNVYKSLREQQFIMQSYNNLALMLHEALKQMEEEMQSMSSCNMSSCSGSGKPKKPGNGKPKLGEAQRLQQQLNQQMKAMQKGQKPGGSQKPGGQKPGNSEQFARMAAKQAQIRRMLQDYRDEMMQEGGTKPGGIDAAIKEMQKTEKDLVNKILNRQTLERQARIDTRLLQAEKAEQEREKSKERKSKEGKMISRQRPPSIKAYELLKQKEEQLLETMPLQFSPYYKQKSEQYFMELKK